MAETNKPIQLAYAGGEQITLSINIICERDRATVIFKNLGERWTVPAMLSARHAQTGKTIARAITMKENQTASFRFAIDQSADNVLGEISAPWMIKSHQVKKTVDCR